MYVDFKNSVWVKNWDNWWSQKIVPIWFLKYLSEGPQSTTISLWLIIPGQFLNFYNVHYVDYKGHDHAHMKKTPNRQCIKIACLFFNSVYSHKMFVANHFSYFRASVRLYIINYIESVTLWLSIYTVILLWVLLKIFL